ncbi:uncharacterized protein Z520_05039 [Fonsecaea multimorphosa CBS 102226]|uniref:Transcription factor domain-containing protein n=1 Tax=Fonsecaea multimorphosa CBS 102226 TaxID=1442371 RepID=A0A0D2KS27_9EURO|nr:uncharacterized protein Z520_05039 [Fonsecaea multimorphosa CBS 102226]KIX99463.1 hypothetical protein Z520_05039 [Fonsecaea multimorphosa CBS 102226]OAL25458.1 hypothetical protein AYO22_04777 [Fonsecaea multimorphosa]
MSTNSRPPVQASFPSATNKSRISGGRYQGYKKIRWKKYDPSKKSPNSAPDQFVQWQPPDAARDEDQDDTIQRKSKPSDGRQNPNAQALVYVSPLEPLPLNGTREDPFLVLPIKSTDAVQDTLDYYITICKGFNTERSVVPGPVNPHLSLLLPFALKHTILFESIISVCRASILISLGKPIWEDYAFVHHRGSAIAGLNERLKSSEATDDASLLTVTMLMTLEYLSGNQRGVVMHCNGLEKMLELRGPLSDDKVDQNSDSGWLKFIKHGLIAYKALGSFVTGQPPKLPRDSVGYLRETFQELNLDQPLAYPEPPFPPDLCIILSRLPSGVSELCVASRISIQMIKLLASISAATTLLATETVSYENLLDRTWTPPSELPLPDSSQYDEEWKQTMIQTILSSLQRMSLTSTEPVEYNLTMGLLAYVFQLRGLAAVNLFYDPILRNFINALPTHTKPASLQEQNSLVWCSMAVAGALALRVVPMPNSNLVMEHVLDLYPQARQWARLEKILRTFYYTKELGTHWKSIWQPAMKRWEQRKTRDINAKPDDGAKGDGEPVEQFLQSFQNPLDFQDFDMNSEAIKAHIRQHIAGAPKTILEMSQAMGLCPVRPLVSSPSTSSSASAATTTSSPNTVLSFSPKPS